MSARRVDAHQHFWRLARGDYAWLTRDLLPLYRDFEPDDLAPMLRDASVDCSVAVQAAATVAETHFLLELADAHPWVVGVVGWVDMESPDAVQTLADLSRHPRLRGIRPMLQDIPDPAWMLGDALTPAYRALVARDLRFDALVRPEHLVHLPVLLDRHPALQVVVDHAAKPAIRANGFDDWAPGIARVANETNALCKLSGLVTEASDGWSVDSLRPYVDHLLATFGPDRLLWGSDWPVVELVSDYRGWRAASLALIAGLGEEERDAILGGNATRFYGLEAAIDAMEEVR